MNADQLYAMHENLWNIDMDPGTIFGVGCRKLTGKELKSFGATKVLLCYDEAMGKFGYTDELTKIIEAEGLSVVSKQVPLGEPTSTGVNSMIADIRNLSIDGIIGLGGGSCMDIAKLIGLVLANGGNAEDYLGYTNKNLEVVKDFRPVICMPTTSGTGAEVSTNLACDDDTKHIKAIGKHRPTLAIVDPEYTVGLPASVTAATGMDALAHCYDSLMNTEPMQNWMADTLGMAGIQTVFEYLPRAVKDGKDIEARARMSFAALTGGYILKFRRCSWGHAFANKVSDEYHYGHGVAISLAMYAIVRYNVKNNNQCTRLAAKALGISCENVEDAGKEIVKRMDALQKEIGMKTMKEAGLTEEFLKKAIELIRNDQKWKVAAAPDFDEMEKAIWEAYAM